MKIIKKLITSLSRKNYLFNHKDKLHSPDFFKQQLLIEKRRAERSGSKSSIMIFDFNNYIQKNGNHNYAAVDFIISTICSNLRETDIISPYKENLLLILLPDTGLNASQHVSQRILNDLTEKKSAHQILDPNDIMIEILSYPEKQTEEYLKTELLNGKDNNNGGTKKCGEMSFDASSIINMNDNKFNKNYIDDLNLCISRYNGSSIAIPIIDAFWGDQENYAIAIQKYMKRCIDFIGALIVFILFLPAMAIISLIVKMTSKGSILFKQVRIGHKGKHFLFYKFRTMYSNAESETHQKYMEQLIKGDHHTINNGSTQRPIYKMKNDPRITSFGRFLRKTSLDELPQLINVILGEMSLVGPRPPISYEVKKYKNWHYRRIFSVKPGITGLWQVTGRNSTTFDEMVRLDIQYAENWSLLLDLKILLKTATTILVGSGS